MEADNFIKHWFAGFESGLEKLPAQERDTLLLECAKQCSRSYPLGIYREAFAKSRGLDDFLHNLKAAFKDLSYSIDNDRKTIVFRYNRCGCELYTSGLVKSPLLCDCSRLSLKYIWESLLGAGNADVELKQSILQGNHECVLEVRLK